MNVLLVVADGPLKRQLKDFFSSRGRDVTVCSGSEQARRELDIQAFSFVLVDLEVDAEAASVCRAIRELPHDERPYSIVLPAAETVQAMRAALAAGADDYLPKPVDPTSLQLRLAIGERRRGKLRKTESSLTPGERRREQYFRSLLESSSDLITIVDPEGHILYQTASSQSLLGWNADEMMGWNVVEHVHPEDRERFAETLKNSVADATATPSVQIRIRRRGGDFHPFESLCKNMLADPVVAGVVVTSRDISEHRRLESELNRERVFFQQLFRNSPSAIVILDPEDRIVDANASFLELFGFELSEIKRKALNDCIVPEELHEEATRLSHSVFSRQPVVHETTRQRRDGSPVEVSVISYPIVVSERLIGAFAIYSDITQRKQAERQLYHHAYHDALTGLPNRAFLSQRLERALRRVQRQVDYLFALLFIDLDHFKVINDSLGHEAGDELLVEMARRLERCVRPGDTTARLGGDEFTVILEDLKDPTDATRIADRILVSLAEPFPIAGQNVGNSGSIGIAYSSPRYKSADELLRDADLAMYRAKTTGKAHYVIFDAEMHERAMRRLELETQLRRAIENEEMVLRYQPIVSLATRRVVGFEALVRWARPRGDLIAAQEVIPICEETGLVIPLGRWVLREVARQVVDWQARHPASDCLVTVNVSAKETAHKSFMSELDRVREETGVHPSSIGFEMSEDVMAGDDAMVKALLWQLRNRGYRIYVDDFGTGQSSLATLYRFPIDVLKIDRSFIQQMARGGESLEIVRAIGALGESLGLGIVAEGVETRQQLARVRQLELANAQGFLFSKPLPPEQAEKLLTMGALWKSEDEEIPQNGTAEAM